MAYMGRRLGCIAVALGTVAWAAWLAARFAGASAHPLWAVVYATEVLGFLTGVVVAVVIARHPRCAASTPLTSTPATLAPSSSNPDVSRSRRHGRDPDGYPAAIGDLLRIAPEPELRASVRNAWRTAFAAHVPIADRALALVRFKACVVSS